MKGIFKTAILAVSLLLCAAAGRAFFVSFGTVNGTSKVIQKGLDNGKLRPKVQPPASPSVSGPSVGGVNTAFSFSATASDPAGKTLRYGWDWDGDGSIEEWSGFLPSGTADSRQHAFTAIGTYSIKVVAANSDGVLSSQVSYPFQCVANNPSTPAAPTGPYSGLISTQYTFTAVTTDPDLNTIRYGWDWDGDGTIDEWSSYVPSGTADARPHSFPLTGTYSIKVLAEDLGGLRSAFSPAKSFQVTYGNPAKPLLSGPSSGGAGKSYPFQAWTTDPAGLQIKYGYDWDGDGTVDEWTAFMASGSTATVSHAFSAGTYSIYVRAKNSSDLESLISDAFPYTAVSAQPDAPVYVSVPTNGSRGQTLSFSANGNDPYLQDVLFGWDWEGDGAVDEWSSQVVSGSTDTRTHIYTATGTYTVGLHLKNALGLEAASVSSATLSITALSTTTISYESSGVSSLSLALNSSGLPRVAYYNGSTVAYASWSGVSVATEVVKPYGGDVSLALDASYLPHIAVSSATSYTAGTLNYYSTSGDWSETVIANGVKPRYVSMAFDTAGNPHVAYYDEVANAVVYVYHNGTAWQSPVTVATQVSYAQFTDISLAMAGTDDARIVYYDSNDYVMKYAQGGSGGFTNPPVAISTTPARYGSLAIDSSGGIHVAYSTATIATPYGAVYIASCTASCTSGYTSWSRERVGTTELAQNVSLAVSGTTPKIMYYDKTAQGPVYGDRSSGSWTLYTVETCGSTAGRVALRLDSSGNPKAAYYCPSDSILKLAY